ncbi:MAG: hypothetical protein HGGPFJEG_00498 [Ignavibacteria bacterium]|nr:hypothetical protein [Ignavibacteria bacterium]
MSYELIKHIGYNDICDIISSARNVLIISMPNITEEIAHTIVEFRNKNNINEVKIILDNSERNFRT